MKKLWRDYHVELIALAFALLGVFLLVEQFQIRATILQALMWLVGGLEQIANRVIEVLVYEATHITLSDALGLVLIALAFVVLVWRVRYRLRRSPNLTGTVCPVCGGPLHRIRRTPLDYVIDRFVPVRRYRCKDPACGWTGLRVKPL